MIPNKITIHCSDSPNGRFVTTNEIRHWHTDTPPKGRGWSDIGYHAVVETDGGWGKGRAEIVEGAHVEGHNLNNLGICMVGKDKFSRDQFSTLKCVLKQWMACWRIPIDNVYCHYQWDTAIAQGKSCPNMKIEDLHAWMLGDNSAIEKYILDTP